MSSRKKTRKNTVTQQQRIAKRMEDAIINGTAGQRKNIDEKQVLEKVKETEAILQEYYDNKPVYSGEVRRGDVFFFDKNNIRVGVEQDGGRPGIVVSNDYSNRHSEFVEVIYCTTQPKKDMATHVNIPSLSPKTIALCEQVHTLSKKKIINRYGRCTDEEMRKVDKALLVNLGLSNAGDVEAETYTQKKIAELDKACAEILEKYKDGKIMKLVEDKRKSKEQAQQEQGFDYKAAYESLTNKILNITLNRIMEVKE